MVGGGYFYKFMLIFWLDKMSKWKIVLELTRYIFHDISMQLDIRIRKPQPPDTIFVNSQ